MLKISTKTITVQLKGNLIPARVLQLEISRVKITSCIQYLNRHPLHLCPHQANYRACVPANVPLILNKLFNETYLILIVYIWWTYKHCLCMFQSILESISYWNIAHVQLCAISHSLLFGVLSFGMENGSIIGDWISINLFVFGLSAGWKPVRKYASY